MSIQSYKINAVRLHPINYALFTLQASNVGISIPIGVALWSPKQQWAKVCFMTEKQCSEHYPVIDLIEQKLRRWLETKQLPYYKKPSSTYTDDWWLHVRSLLIHRVRLSKPKSIECFNPDDLAQLLCDTLTHESRIDETNGFTW